jgi:hypothetical protein
MVYGSAADVLRECCDDSAKSQDKPLEEGAWAVPRISAVVSERDLQRDGCTR